MRLFYTTKDKAILVSYTTLRYPMIYGTININNVLLYTGIDQDATKYFDQNETSYVTSGAVWHTHISTHTLTSVHT
jgi:hypothetical protein